MPGEIQLWEILVPTVRRVSGAPYRLRYHKVWDKWVRDLTGGMTITKPAKGQWVSPSGELFVERMIPVRIACTREQIEKIIKHTLIYYDQLAVMAYKISDDVIIQHAEQRRTK